MTFQVAVAACPVPVTAWVPAATAVAYSHMEYTPETFRIRVKPAPTVKAPLSLVSPMQPKIKSDDPEVVKFPVVIAVVELPATICVPPGVPGSKKFVLGTPENSSHWPPIVVQQVLWAMVGAFVPVDLAKV